MAALTEPLQLSDLVESGGCVFNFNSGSNDADASDSEEPFGFGENGENDVIVTCDDLKSPWTKPFAELIPSMEKVDRDIYKKILIAGDKEKGHVPDKARVLIRYNCFWEGEGTPYDSTYLRGETLRFYIGVSDVLLGIQKAVQTMLAGEKAQFIVGYELLYGEYGCPPRIKPRADSLIIIELLSFTCVGNLNAYEELKEDEKKDFGSVLKSAEDINLKAKDFFKQSMFKQAKQAFIKALDSVISFALADTDDDARKQQDDFLIKSYTNLSICYNKLNLPHEALKMIKEAKRLTGNNKPPAKALYNEGVALIAIGEYDDARNALTKASKLYPFNNDINNKLKDLSEKQTKFKADEKKLWRKAFQNTEKEKKDDKEKQEKEGQIISMLQKFKNSDIKRLHLVSDLMIDDIDLTKKLAESLQIKLQINSGDLSKCVLIKPVD